MATLGNKATSLVALPDGVVTTAKFDAAAKAPLAGTADYANAGPSGSAFSFRNKIINGGMEIAQRGTSFVNPATGTYLLDRFARAGVFGDITYAQNSDSPSNEFSNSLRVTNNAASVPTTSQANRIVQVIEGYNVRDLIGRDFTLSFRVRSSKTGVHCIAFQNTGSDRTYVSEYTVNAANTWETKSVTVSGGLITTGTWDWTNGGGLSVAWMLAAGSTLHTPANAWQTGSFFATANQVNCLDTIGNIFAITGVQLEAGSVATPFEHRPYGTELALCQRYYTTVNHNQRFYAAAASYNMQQSIYFGAMRAAPTAAVVTAGTVTNSSVATLSSLSASGYGVLTVQSSATGDVIVSGRVHSLSIEL